MRLFTQLCGVAIIFLSALSHSATAVKCQIDLKPLDSVSKVIFCQFMISHSFFFPPQQEFCYLIKSYLFGSNRWDYLNEAVCSAVLPDLALLCLWWGPFLGCPALVPPCLWWIKGVTPVCVLNGSGLRVTGITSFCAQLPVIPNNCWN